MSAKQLRALATIRSKQRIGEDPSWGYSGTSPARHAPMGAGVACEAHVGPRDGLPCPDPLCTRGTHARIVERGGAQYVRSKVACASGKHPGAAICSCGSWMLKRVE